MSNFLYEYIRTFVRVIFLIRIYSYIRSRQDFHACHTLEQNSLGHFLLSKGPSNAAVDEVNEPGALSYVCHPVSEFNHVYFVGSSYVQGEKY